MCFYKYLSYVLGCVLTPGTRHHNHYVLSIVAFVVRWSYLAFFEFLVNKRHGTDLQGKFVNANKLSARECRPLDAVCGSTKGGRQRLCDLSVVFSSGEACILCFAVTQWGGSLLCGVHHSMRTILFIEGLFC